MEIEHLIRYTPRAVGLMAIENLFRYPALAVGLMEIEHLIRYTELVLDHTGLIGYSFFHTTLVE